MLGVLGVLGLTATSAAAEGPAMLPAGTIEVGVAGGYSATFNNGDGDRQTIYGYHALLRFGAIVTDEHGPGILRGNFELGLQPMYIHLDEKPTAKDVYGAAFEMRWLFAGNGTLRPYVEGGAGVLGGRAGPRTGNCEPNFVLEGGPGVLIFMSQHAAIDIGYRVHHISNGNQCSNQGFNSNMGVIGLSYFFH